MNRIGFSACGGFLELWHNGQKIRWVKLAGRLHDSVGELSRHCHEWGGGGPTLDREVRAKMREADAALQRMAFGGEYR